MKLVAIVGTNAKHSYNRLLLKSMAKHFAKEADIEILEITDVPMFNETDDQTESAVIQTFNTKITEADGLSSLHQNTIIPHQNTIIPFHQA